MQTTVGQPTDVGSLIAASVILCLVMGPKDAGGIANSVDPDQTSPLGAV